MTDDRQRVVYSDDPINPPMGEGRWQDALRRMRKRIAEGLELVYWDDETIGNKETHCSWGMCSTDAEQWPDKDDHIFPTDFERRNRIAPRDPPEKSGCPFDQRTHTPGESRWGCFYHCQVFKHGRISKDNEKTRKYALILYDQVLETREARGRRTAVDDHKPWRET